MRAELVTEGFAAWCVLLGRVGIYLEVWGLGLGWFGEACFPRVVSACRVRRLGVYSVSRPFKCDPENLNPEPHDGISFRVSEKIG